MEATELLSEFGTRPPMRLNAFSEGVCRPGSSGSSATPTSGRSGGCGRSSPGSTSWSRPIQAPRRRGAEGQDRRVPPPAGRAARRSTTCCPRRSPSAAKAGRRFLKMRHYDVQLMGGMVLHGGNIAEMVTGEGKTLVATLAAYLNALEGKGVHVITVNDYLARRDAEWMSPLYQRPGPDRRRHPVGDGPPPAAADLRLRHHLRHQQRVRLRLPPRQHEADPRDAGAGPAALRDHRRGRQHPDRRGPDPADHLRPGLRRRPQVRRGRPDRPAAQGRATHFEVKEKERTAHLNEDGIREAEQLAGVESFYTPGNMEWPHLIDNSLKAHHLYKRDRDYVVSRQGRDRHRRRVHRPADGRPPVVRRPPPGGRGQGAGQDQGGEPDPRHDHAPELLQALRASSRA